MDDLARGREVSERWTRESRSHAPAAGGGPFTCDLHALTKGESETHRDLARALWAAVQEQSDLPNGYGLRLPPEMLIAAAEWMSLERKCCPFFTFEIEVGRDGGPLWLRITGDEGIKAFIRVEFRLDG